MIVRALVVGGAVTALWLAAALVVVAANRVANGPRRAAKPTDRNNVPGGPR